MMKRSLMEPACKSENQPPDQPWERLHSYCNTTAPRGKFLQTSQFPRIPPIKARTEVAIDGQSADDIAFGAADDAADRASTACTV